MNHTTLTTDDKRLAQASLIHTKKMQRKKAVIDAQIHRAQQNKGLLLVMTGNGKGKSSSAFGMVARALGHQQKVAVAQFIKGRRDSGEELFFRQQVGVQWLVLGEGFTWETQHLERDRQTAQRGWAKAKKLLTDTRVNLVVLDELSYPLRYQWLDMAQVIHDLSARPPMQHVIITGRAVPKPIQDMADTVSAINDIKHAYRAGIAAQAGIDL